MKSARMLLILLLSLGLSACQTWSFWGGEEEAVSEAAPESTDAPLVMAPEPAYSPGACVAQLKAGPGPYPTLFLPSSTAIWVGPDVAAYTRQLTVAGGKTITPGLEQDAQEILDKYAVIECMIESAFGDSSIAYDAVAMRGVAPSLQAGDGKPIAPVQVITGALDSGENRGALKTFRRTVLLVFPLKDSKTDELLIDRKAPSVRLVLDAYGTAFYFEWPAGTATPQTWDEHVRGILSKIDYNDLFQRLRRAVHTFD